MQVPSREADANDRTKKSPAKCKEEGASTTSMPAKEEIDVKNEPESESAGSRPEMPAQTSQP